MSDAKKDRKLRVLGHEGLPTFYRAKGSEADMNQQFIQSVLID